MQRQVIASCPYNCPHGFQEYTYHPPGQVTVIEMQRCNTWHLRYVGSGDETRVEIDS